jgi:hypothetical protein
MLQFDYVSLIISETIPPLCDHYGLTDPSIAIVEKKVG